ncbi:MAG: helix-turn-helix transcriptional regulator [Pseudomonadota bacterium]|nr:helix-turn-helix transcriptional regulator [Pseudomonadota bacterium]
MINHTVLKLIAQRKALGLNMSELATLPNISQSNKVIADYERGRRKPAQSYINEMKRLSVNYTFLIQMMEADIKKVKVINPKYELSLPFFSEFLDFKVETGNGQLQYWRVWQAAVSHLVMTGLVSNLNDGENIPETMINTKSYLSGQHDAVLESLCGIFLLDAND